MNTATLQENVLNGVNTTRLANTIEAIRMAPKLGEFQFRAQNTWENGGRNHATINGYRGAAQELQRSDAFRLVNDEPPVLLGRDSGPNPVEYVLAGLSGCMTTTLAYHAAARGLEIESISSSYEGDIDLRGLFDIDPDVRSGYREIRVKFRVRGGIDEETIKELVQKSPVFDTLRNPVNIRIEVEKA